MAGINLLIVKRDKSREEFDREKLLRNVRVACHKREVSAQQIDTLVQDVETDLYAMGRGEIPSREVGELVMRKLQNLDEVAYVRFASVYRSFQDVNAFHTEIDRLQQEQQKRHES